ncbi:MAG: SOS response-associated peptidase [bacterium]
MCGRYNLTTDAQALLDFFQIQLNLFGEFSPRFNIAPSQTLPVIIHQDEERGLIPSQWGLVPFWSREPKTKYSTINARSETVASAASFREPFKRSRCIVPATGYYEWQAIEGRKQPYNIASASGGVFALAGIYDIWHVGEEDQLHSFSIITIAANEAMRKIHKRMPVILGQDSLDTWLSGSTPKDKLGRLLAPCPSEWLKIYPVSTIVNNPRNDGPDCIDPTKSG